MTIEWTIRRVHGCSVLQKILKHTNGRSSQVWNKVKNSESPLWEIKIKNIYRHTCMFVDCAVGCFIFILSFAYREGIIGYSTVH